MTEESRLEKRKLLRDINLMGADYYEKFYQQTFLEWQKFGSVVNRRPGIMRSIYEH